MYMYLFQITQIYADDINKLRPYVLYSTRLYLMFIFAALQTGRPIILSHLIAMSTLNSQSSYYFEW